MPDVYATARGPLARLAGPAPRAPDGAGTTPSSPCRRRGRVSSTSGAGRSGCARSSRRSTSRGRHRVAAGYPGPFVQADAAAGLPFADGEFELVYCSSVIEHVPPPRRAAFASELRRVGRGWMVQTPARSFPIEPHSLLPFAHWLPPGPRRRYWRLGAARGWEEIDLLSRGELELLFGPARAERLGPLVKSWVSVRTPRP